MSALLDTALRAPAPASGLQPLLVADGIRLTLEVARGTDPVPAVVSVRGDAAYAAATALHVTSPQPAYTHPSQEPDDHSLVARTERMAVMALASSPPTPVSLLQLWSFCYAFWTLWPDQEMARLACAGMPWADALSTGLATAHPADIQAGREPHDDGGSRTVLVHRTTFWQGAGPLAAGGWVPDALVRPYPYLPVTYQTAPFPTRLAHGDQRPYRPPSHAAGPWYRRYIPAFRQTLTFRPARSDEDGDVDLLHRWHANDRVKTGWRQDLPRDVHRQYLADLEARSDAQALIGEWDGEPFGYVEVYYARESNLRSFYDARDYDRGFHALLIDLPHKRAALVRITRERFFQLCPLGPLPGNKV
ncbi:hypothetical protein MSPP1_000461 [Malassezia sp. CBS 17886]|nr:hypothetical protein MSPP1_000461 [Malassezia sp. CBS 17886]